jgi:hypothetical protein
LRSDLTRVPRPPFRADRPEFQLPWAGQPHVTVIVLNRLGRSDGAAMVERLAGEAASLPQDVIAEIVERTDGVPLFVEEMTKATTICRSCWSLPFDPVQIFEDQQDLLLPGRPFELPHQRR